MSKAQFMTSTLWLTIPIWIGLSVTPVVAQVDENLERRIDPRELLTLKEEVENNTALSEDVQARAVALYEDALEALARAEAREARSKSLQQEQEAVGPRIEQLREELGVPPIPTPLELAPGVTANELEDRLIEERSELAELMVKLQRTEQLPQETSARRRELSRRLASLPEELDRLGDELRETAEDEDLHPEIQRAARRSLLARRQAALAEARQDQAQLDLFSARDALIPWLRDKARRDAQIQTELIQQLEVKTRETRRAEARRRLRDVQERCRELARVVPALGEALAQIEKSAEMLWGVDGVPEQSDRTSRALATVRRNTTEMDRIIELTRRRVEALGLWGSSVNWWPTLPEDFPTYEEQQTKARELRALIPLVQHQRILFEEERSEELEMSARAVAILRESRLSSEEQTRLETNLRQLLTIHRDILEELIRRYGTYADTLAELEGLSQRLLETDERIQSFVYERLYWRPSVPGSLVPKPKDVADALLWLVSGENWRSAWSAAARVIAESPLLFLSFVVVFVLLVIGRRSVVQRIEALGSTVRDDSLPPSLKPTLEALLLTSLLAAPLPLALYVGSRLFIHDVSTSFVYSLGTALYYLAQVAGVLEISRQLLRPGGVMEAHFGRRGDVTRAIHNGLFWPQMALLPLFLALVFASAGLRLTSPEELQVYNNSAGRLLFVVAMAAMAMTLAGVFRPRLKEGRLRPEFTQVSLYAAPAIGIVTVFPGVLAVLGYYLTAVYAAYLLVRTLWLGVGLVVLYGVLQRWQAVGFKLRAASGEPLSAEELEESQAKTKHLFRFAIVFVGAIGLYGTSGDTVTALHALERVQLWPTLAFIERETETLVAAPRTSSEVAVPENDTPNRTDETTAVEPAKPPLTAWDVLLALLALAVTAALVRDVPGLVELVLSRETRVDSGARVATSALVRYALVIGGLMVMSGLLGLSWSSVQWLAAALTVGLGFGLQEIVANFVSGLILLVERPVRIGDAVTIGNLSGRITRIRMRATTISLWDRSEMVVPNKEFIVGKLVNWTLSDSRRRIEIPVRVRYGADVAKVKNLLLELATAHPAVLEDPPPQVLLQEFTDDALRFELWIYVEFRQGLKTKDELLVSVDKVFRENGIVLGGPSLTLQIPEKGTRPTPAP